MTAAAPFRRLDLLAAPSGRLHMVAAVMGGPFDSVEAAARAAGLSPHATRLIAAELATGVDAATVGLAELLADHAVTAAARSTWAGADPVETVVVVATLGPARFVVAAGDLRLVAESAAAAERGAEVVRREAGVEVVLVEIPAALPSTLRSLWGTGP